LKYKFYILFFIIVLFLKNATAQCEVKNNTFKNNEFVKYQVYYNWGFIWLKAGEVTFNAKDTVINNTELWKFISTGKSYTSYDWIFKVRDNFESIVYKKNLKPLYYHRKTLEGHLLTDNEYVFNHKKKKIYSSTYNSKSEIKRDTLELTDCIFDVLSATYFTRSLDFTGMKINDSIPITTIMDNEKINIYVKYLGKEEITHKNKKQYMTIKFSTTVAEGSVFKGGEQIIVWVSDDKNKIPILIKADIIVGSVKVYLIDKNNLKYKSSF